MTTRTVEKNVLVTDDGEELFLMERPEGLGTFADYHRKVEEYRRQYPEMFARLPSFDEYLRQRREEAVWE